MRAGLLALMLAAAPVALPAEPVAVASAAQLSKLTRDTARSLARAQVVRGAFVQQRHLAGLSRPLESEGRFLFARGTGIEWHTEKPFDSQFILTESGMTQRDEGGETLHVSVADQPALTVVSRVFFALFALDFNALSQDFTMSGADAPGAPWKLVLKPKTAALGAVFRQALVTGDASVTSVRLEDANGDVTEIGLRDVQYDPKGLTADERRRF
jgi:outer membrane lipoprotein-sorting protein